MMLLRGITKKSGELINTYIVINASLESHSFVLLLVRGKKLNFAIVIEL